MSSAFPSASWSAALWDSPGAGQAFGLELELVETLQSPFQQISLVRNPSLGRGLLLDGNSQFWEADEWIYHEHLAALPLLLHPAPRHVLILGGGDGLALRETLADPRVEQVTLVDLDGAVVAACRQFCPDLLAAAFADPRLDLRIGDALMFLQAAPQPADVVLIDLIDPVTPAGLALYTRCLDLLPAVQHSATLVSTHGDCLPGTWTALRLLGLLADRFPWTGLHRAWMPGWASEWGFVLAGDPAPSQLAAAAIAERAALRTRPLRSLQPAWYPGALTLPPYFEQLLSDPRPQVLRAE